MDHTKIAKLSEVFSPSAPIVSNDLFVGRLKEVSRIVDAILEKGQHAILYGERGVGKTSLANILNDRIKGIIVSKVTCKASEDFLSLWRKALEAVRLGYQTAGVGYKPQSGSAEMQLDLLLPNTESLTPLDVERILASVSARLLFIFDEFDRIESPDLIKQFSDLIKGLSDNHSDVTILLVGVAHDVDDLIGSHPSIERCLKQIKMPRMSRQELTGILEKGALEVGFKFNPEVIESIVDFSDGFPHYTHLLGKYAAKQALMTDHYAVDTTHFNQALGSALDDVSESTRKTYETATITSKQNKFFEEVLWAAGVCTRDEFDNFTANDVSLKFAELTGQDKSREGVTYYLTSLCKKERGEILEKVGHSKNIKYRFKNPMAKAYVKLRLYTRNQGA